MTQLDVMYRYGVAPTETAMMALGRVREVYGIRRVQVDEAARTVRVEYDATRLTEAIVHQLLRRSGVDITERVLLAQPPVVEAEPAAAKT
jgi:copper chaperone CopZ